MKINFLLPSVGIGGGARVVFEYANRLTERGHDVTVLYPLVPSQMEKSRLDLRPRSSQVLGTVRRLVSSDGVDWFGLKVPVQHIPTLAPNIIKYFGRTIPDADITVATAWETAYTVASLDSSKGEKAYFVQHYEIWNTWNSDEAWEQVSSLTDDSASYPIEMYEVTPSSTKARRQKELVDNSYELPLSKITISSWLEKLLESKFDQEVAGVITNSVNHSIFYPEQTIDSERVSLLLPSRDTPWKGERETRDLVNEIGSAYDVDIHMYGSRSEQGAYPDYVTLHPHVSDEKLRHLYSNADIFVLPSWVEGGGLPPLEAMACKCAVVATNVGGVPDYAEDGVTASIVPPRDSSALIEAVCELIENEDERHRLQARGYNHVMEYTWNDATKEFEQVLREIA
jgi:glycosyltransferase involved in cell wall biosynthesis